LIKFIIVISILLLLVGCSSNTIYKTKGTSNKKLHQFYGNSQTEVIQKDVIKGDVFYFITSYYGTKFHGRPTSNGEVFDMNKLTCAHKTLPFNTILKVTNEDNGKSVVVRVNDRGPFIKGRDLDLSFAAAKEIGLIGVGVKQLQVEILESPKSE